MFRPQSQALVVSRITFQIALREKLILPSEVSFICCPLTSSNHQMQSLNSIPVICVSLYFWVQANFVLALCGPVAGLGWSYHGLPAGTGLLQLGIGAALSQ